MKRLLLWLPAIAPLYILRLHIGPIPTTGLELAILALIAGITATDSRAWIRGWHALGAWRGPMLAWMGVTALAVGIAPQHLAALGLWRAYILEPLLIAVLLRDAIRTEDDRIQVLRALVTGAAGASLWAISQFVTGVGIPHPWNTDLLTRRATGPFPFPNALALYCAPIAVACFAQLREEHHTSHQKWWISGGVLAIIATLLAKSAGGTIAILTCLAILGIAEHRTRTTTLRIGALIIGFALLVSRIRTPLFTLLSFHGWSGGVRLVIWKETLAMLKEHPFFGAGFGAYPQMIAAYHHATYLEIFQYPHNILLNLWSETGILGIIAFTWICITWIRESMNASKLTAALPLIAMLVHGIVDVPYFKNDLAMLFWIFAMLTLPIRLQASEPHRSTLA